MTLFSLGAMSLSGCATLPMSGPTAGRIERQQKSVDNSIAFQIQDLTTQAIENHVPLSRKEHSLVDLPSGYYSSGWRAERHDI